MALRIALAWGHVSANDGKASLALLDRNPRDALEDESHLAATDIARHMHPTEERIANFLDEKEFRTNGRGHRVESSFVNPSELAAGKEPPEGYTLEPWSRAFLEKKWLP